LLYIFYHFIVFILFLLILPFNLLCLIIFKNRFQKGSVLHISFPVHTAFQTVELLKENGFNAKYLSIGKVKNWTKSDYNIQFSSNPFTRIFQEIYFFWNVISKYEIIHSHFMISLSAFGMDFLFLKLLGRKIVIHYRGCEIRDRKKNMNLHPDINICSDCDYYPRICQDPVNILKKNMLKNLADSFIVTTPDMLDFIPNASVLTFFIPDYSVKPLEKEPNGKLKILHVTNHPGIEGTLIIKKIIDKLIEEGYPIEFVIEKGISHKTVLDKITDFDLTIGKMKMGYYANFQVESMALGIPCITYVRKDLMTNELEESSFIFSTLDKLRSDLIFLCKNPEYLSEKRKKTVNDINKIHNNKLIIEKLINIYSNLKEES